MAHAAQIRARLGGGALALLAATCGAPERPRPNVLLISLDSTRRDMLGVYGYRSPGAPQATNTPSLEALAAGGVVMEAAYSTTSWTLPSHVALLAGEPELVHAVDLDYQRPDPRRPVLPEILREAGFRTAGFFSGPYLEPHFGFARGFERYESRYGSQVALAARSAEAARQARALAEDLGPGPALSAALEAEAEADRVQREVVRSTLSSEQVTEAVLEELEQAARADRPFFLFAHYFDPHYDYVPPAPFDRRFDPAYEGSLAIDDFLNNPAISLPDERDPFRRRRVVSERDLEHVRSLYAGELAWTDAQLGRILAKLDELGLAGDTLVVVTADHGDEFFEHQNLGHRSTLFEEQVRVPMILRLPGRLPAGRRVGGLVSTIDILPTVLELCGLEAPQASTSRRVAALAAGEDDGPERFVLGRIVRHSLGRLRLPRAAGGEVELAATRLTLLETYREGPIKITRERNWAALQEEPRPALRAAFDRQSQAMRAQEGLRWIDVERHPAERPAEHSSDFSDPRAAASLRRFQELYRALLARRGQAARVEAGARDSQLSALEALGYAGVDPGAAFDGDTFVFPPPGE
jgi:arylsulfatase A-like enzyme